MPPLFYLCRPLLKPLAADALGPYLKLLRKELQDGKLIVQPVQFTLQHPLIVAFLFLQRLYLEYPAFHNRRTLAAALNEVAKPFATFSYYCLMCVYARLGLTVTFKSFGFDGIRKEHATSLSGETAMSCAKGILPPFHSFFPNLLRPNLLRPEIQLHCSITGKDCIVGVFP